MLSILLLICRINHIIRYEYFLWKFNEHFYEMSYVNILLIPLLSSSFFALHQMQRKTEKISSLTMIMQFRKNTHHGCKCLSFCNSNAKRIAKIYKIFDTIKKIKHGLIKITNINYVEDWKSVIGSCSCNNLSFPFLSFNDSWNKMSICFMEWRSFVNFDVLNIWVLDFLNWFP